MARLGCLETPLFDGVVRDCLPNEFREGLNLYIPAVGTVTPRRGRAERFGSDQNCDVVSLLSSLLLLFSLERDKPTKLRS